MLTTLKRKLWQPIDLAQFVTGQVKLRWWQGLVQLGSAPPRVVACPILVNWLVAKARNLWVWIRMPRGTAYDRARDAAWKEGYDKGFKTGMQSGRTMRDL